MIQHIFVWSPKGKVQQNKEKKGHKTREAYKKLKGIKHKIVKLSCYSYKHDNTLSNSGTTFMGSIHMENVNILHHTSNRYFKA